MNFTSKINYRADLLKGIFCCLLLTLSSCGGGGGDGDGDFIGAAQVRMSAVPQKIDTGDRTELTITIDSVIENGIALKLRFPPGLIYVPDSAQLEVDGSFFPLNPSDNLTSGNFTYLVFYINRDLLGKGNFGELTLFLQGLSRVISGKIEIDADVDDPRLPNTGEFDITNPGFTAEDQVEIEVDM